MGAAAATLVDRGRVRFEVPKDDRRDTRRREYMAEEMRETTKVSRGWYKLVCVKFEVVTRETVLKIDDRMTTGREGNKDKRSQVP